jgi:ribose transport system permease protein
MTAAIPDTLSAEPGTGPSGNDRVTKLRRRLLNSSPALMSVVLALLILFFSIANPSGFATFANARNILMDTAILLVMAVGVTFVMVAAGFDLSIGSVLVFAQVCSVKVMGAMGDQGLSTMLVGLLVAIVAGSAWGLFNGWCIAKLKVPALITTLGSLGAALGFAYLLTGGNDVRTVPKLMRTLNSQNFLGIKWIVWIALIVTVIGGLVLALTKFGRHTYIIGSNTEAARRAGINVDKHLIKLYMLCSTLAGLAGFLSLLRYGTTTISGHGTDSLAVITGVILGGTSLFGGSGLMAGTVVGLFIPTVLNNGFVVMNVPAFWQQVAIGLILIAAVYLDQLKRRRREQP